jgi:hypothetical protein
MPRLHGDCGTHYSIDHQNSPTPSFHLGRYLFTFIKNNLASKPLHKENGMRDKKAAVVIMLCGFLRLHSNEELDVPMKI